MPLGAIGGGLLAGGIISAGVGIYGAIQQGKAASSQRGIADQQAYQSSVIFGEQQGFEAQLEALLKDPSSVTKLPGYEFNFNEGATAVSRQMASQGLGGSGNQMAALTKYGQDYAMNTFNQQASLLMSLSGITAASSPSQGGAVAGQNMAAANDQLNNSLANYGITAGFLSGKIGGAAGGSGAPVPPGTVGWGG